MNRREFFKGLGAAALVVPSTKFIFDLGAHKYLYDPLSRYTFTSTIRAVWIQVPNPDYMNATHEEIRIYGIDEAGKAVEELYPRRFDVKANKFVEVLPFA